MMTKRKPTRSTDPDPDLDGGWAWMVLAGSSLSLFLTCLIYIGGIFNVVFLEVFGKSKQATAWLLATQSSLLSLMAPLSSLLTDRIGCRWTSILGGAVGTLGYILAFFSRDFGFMFLSFGIIVGAGFGISYCPSIVIISMYFERKRNLAYGAVTACVSIGTIVVPRLITFCTDHYGWRGCLLVLAGLMLQQVLCGCVYRPKHRTDLLQDLEVNNDTQKLNEITREDSDCDTYSIAAQNETPERLIDKSDVLLKEESKSVSEMECPQKTGDYQTVADDALLEKNNVLEMPSYHRKRNKFSFMSKRPFVLYCLTNLLTNVGIFTSYVHFPAYFIEKGATDAWISNCYLAAGIANILCRLLGGLATNSEDIPVMIVFIASCWLSGITVLMCPILAYSGAGQICFSVFLGLFGWYFSLMAPVTIDIVGKEDLPMAYGMQNLFGGIGGLVGPPFAGWLYDTSGDYKYSFITAGLVFVLSGILMMVIPVITDKSATTSKREISSNEEETC